MENRRENSNANGADVQYKCRLIHNELLLFVTVFRGSEICFVSNKHRHKQTVFDTQSNGFNCGSECGRIISDLKFFLLDAERQCDSIPLGGNERPDLRSLSSLI